MDSTARPVSYVHSPVQCDICTHGHPARHYCDHDECREYICDNCLSAHSKYKTHHGDSLQRVLVSVVDSKCYKKGHSERLASHLCVTCQKPVCDDCRDVHHNQGHPFTEIQSAVAGLKIKISNSLDQLKDKMRRQSQKLCDSALDLETTVNHKFEELSRSVNTNIENAVRLVEDHGRRLQDQLENKKQQMLKDLQSSMEPLRHDQTTASSEVIFEAQDIIDCGDARKILSKGGTILQRTAKEVEHAKMNDVLHVYVNHFTSRKSRMRMIPEETAYDLGQVRCMWEQVCSLPFSDVSKRSCLAPLPRGGFVMGASYCARQSHTSVEDLIAAQSQELLETGRNDTKLSFFAGSGELIQAKDIGMLIENEKVRGITVLPCGKIAVLGRYIQMYNSNLEPCGVIKPVKGHNWESIGVGPSGLLLAGDCVNNCIDVLSADGLIHRSISCPGVEPWQLHAFPPGKFVISQVGIHAEAIIKILNRDGSVAWSLSDGSWVNAYCSADSLGNLYIANVVVDSKVTSGTFNARLNIVRYTHEGKRQETILEDEIVENCLPFSIAAQKDGAQIALCSTERLCIFK